MLGINMTVWQGFTYSIYSFFPVFHPWGVPQAEEVESVQCVQCTQASVSDERTAAEV